MLWEEYFRLFWEKPQQSPSYTLWLVELGGRGHVLPQHSLCHRDLTVHLQDIPSIFPSLCLSPLRCSTPRLSRGKAFPYSSQVLHPQFWTIRDLPDSGYTLRSYSQLDQSESVPCDLGVAGLATVHLLPFLEQHSHDSPLAKFQEKDSRRPGKFKAPS